MARISRIVVSGYPHHVTQRGVRSMDVFHSDADRRFYIRTIKEETERFDVEVLAWCLMDNHVHFIAIPRHETSLAKSFGEAHKKYTRMKNLADGTAGYLFQGRFGSCVLDEFHLLAAVRYVESNPVRAGIAKTAWDYPWSSAAFHVGNINIDLLVKDRTLMGLIDDWRAYLAEDQNLPTENIRKATKIGRPAGNKNFIETMERLTGRALGKQKPGPRPR